MYINLNNIMVMVGWQFASFRDYEKQAIIITVYSG